MNKFFDLNPSFVSELAEKCKGNQKDFDASEPLLKSLKASIQQYMLLLALKHALEDEWKQNNDFENLVYSFHCKLLHELDKYFGSESERLQDDIKNLLSDEAAEQEKIRHILEKAEAYSEKQDNDGEYDDMFKFKVYAPDKLAARVPLCNGKKDYQYNLLGRMTLKEMIETLPQYVEQEKDKLQRHFESMIQQSESRSKSSNNSLDKGCERE